MKKTNLNKTVHSMRKHLETHSPQILTGLGIGGMIGTVVLAVKATPKAMELLEQEKDCRVAMYGEIITNEEHDKATHLTLFDVIKVGWKPYIPAIGLGITSAACLIGANSVSTKRTAALAAAYQITENALSEYKEKVIETIGEKKEQEVRDKIAEKHISENPVSASKVIITGRGDTLCYDVLSGQYFYADIDKVKRAESVLNHNLYTDMYVSLNELYDEIGLEHTKLGSLLGWNIDDGMIRFYYSSQLADDGRPCLVLDYDRPPRYDYSKLVY